MSCGTRTSYNTTDNVARQGSDALIYGGTVPYGMNIVFVVSGSCSPRGVVGFNDTAL